ncbi:MAG: hypothetical protein ACRD5M_06440 [Candidatus Acidiferrales bacterium]
MTLKLILIALAATAGILTLLRIMRKVRLRLQFIILLGLSITIGFLFLMMVQLPAGTFPQWFGVSLVTIVFVASLFGTRIFLRSLNQEEREEEDGSRREAPGNSDSGNDPMKPSSSKPENQR